MRICYIASLNVGVCWWRIENYANTIFKLYKNKDIKIHVEYFFDPRQNIAWDKVCLGETDTAKQIQSKLFGIFDYFDVVIFQKIQNIEALALIKHIKEDVKKEGKDPAIMVTEVDDSIGDTSPSNPYMVKSEHSIAAEHIMRSDAVICSTEYLAGEIRKINPNTKIHVAPNCINYQEWKVKKNKIEYDKFRICYVGAGGHDEDLKIAYKAMISVLDKNDNVELIIRYGGFRPDYLKDHHQIDFKTVQWNLLEYPQKLYNLKADLALAPLRDTNFNRCKSSIKWLEWASLGVPVLASWVEPYGEVNGAIILVNNNLESWELAINNYMHWGKNRSFPQWQMLKKQARQNYNINKETKRLLKFFSSLL